MADMVFSPTFADLDSEREVVLEEIAMVEDAPQDLVHDLLSEAVFGGHPLGRPVIGRAEVISSITRRSIAAYHRRATSPATSSSPRPGNLDARAAARAARAAARRARRAAGGTHARRGRRSSASRRPACASSGRTPSSSTSASARPASPAPTGGASPPRSSTRSSAARRRRGSSRRSARSAGWPTRSTASARSTPTRA